MERAKFEYVTGIGMPIELMFNPKELTHAKSTERRDNQFLGTKEDDLTVTTIFDSYEIREDVTKDHFDKRFNRMIAGTKRILDLASPTVAGQKTKQPPIVKFTWGSIIEYVGVVKNVQEKFTLFLETGVPVRSEVTVTLQSVFTDEAKFTEAKGLSACRKGRIVNPKDRLDLIAAEELKDPALWYKIAQANNIANPLDFPDKSLVHQVLIIPDL